MLSKQIKDTEIRVCEIVTDLAEKLEEKYDHDVAIASVAMVTCNVVSNLFSLIAIALLNSEGERVNIGEVKKNANRVLGSRLADAFAELMKEIGHHDKVIRYSQCLSRYTEECDREKNIDPDSN